MSSTYLIALGSNMRHRVHGPPRAVIGAAMEECAALGTVTRRSDIIDSAPMGPARRRFANAACLIESEYDPTAMLSGLKRLEREFGRRSGQRWGDRSLDCDIILWSGQRFDTAALTIPHQAFRLRSFVLTPAAQIAPSWRDPVSHLTLRQLDARLTAARPLPR